MSTAVPPVTDDPTAAPVPGAAEAPGLRAAIRKLTEGELGSMRVVIVLFVIWAIFTIADSSFLTSRNLTGLAQQTAALGMVSVGVVFVLLLGEIDLSVGAVSGLAASVMAVLNVKHGWNPYLAMVAGLVVGAAIGVFQGTVATRLAIPTFVVTLAGLLAWPGAQLKVLGSTGTVNIDDAAITNLGTTFLAHWLAWVVAIVAIAAFAAATALTFVRRTRAGLETEPLFNAVVRVGATAVAILAAVAVLNGERGLALSMLVLVGVVVVCHAVLSRTTFGRHVYAVGGNAEAARRAGINVTRVRITVFMLASTFAAAGGILAAARLLAVNQSSGGSDLLLLAIAGPVIAGVSLFGGRGIVWSALLGALVVQSISNGMDLLSLESSVKFMVTGAVLLAAVSLDAILLQRRRAHGRL
jgi:D-xylose transport system permease protein